MFFFPTLPSNKRVNVVVVLCHIPPQDLFCFPDLDGNIGNPASLIPWCPTNIVAKPQGGAPKIAKLPQIILLARTFGKTYVIYDYIVSSLPVFIYIYTYMSCVYHGYTGWWFGCHFLLLHILGC